MPDPIDCACGTGNGPGVASSKESGIGKVGMGALFSREHDQSFDCDKNHSVLVYNYYIAQARLLQAMDSFCINALAMWSIQSPS